MPDSIFQFTPIGVINTPYDDRYRAPRQPGTAPSPVEGIITLNPGMNFEQALEDLAGFERIWIIYVFDRNATWKPKVLPPRSPRRKRGLFATRSPHRPNPIGLSLVRLLEVKGATLRVAEVDILDGTPILDIKPYLPYVEAFPASRMGWLDEVIEEERAGMARVEWSALAEEQAEWLAERHGIDFREHAASLLARDPSPHPYRRIGARPEGGFVLAIKSWRILFEAADGVVTIERIASGYAPETLQGAESDSLHDGAAHLDFHRRWIGSAP